MTKVLKFGGTSVGSAANMKRVAEIIRHEKARITVLFGHVGYDRRAGSYRHGCS